jgi:hypothetical protein
MESQQAETRGERYTVASGRRNHRDCQKLSEKGSVIEHRNCDRDWNV